MGTRRSARRAVLAAFVAAAVASGSVPLMGASPAEATALPALTDPFTDAATKLIETSMLPELNQLVPGLATNPAQLFGLHTVFAKLSMLTPAADLETAIPLLNGDGFTFSEVTPIAGPPKDTADVQVGRSTARCRSSSGSSTATSS